jgi:hypothetical protein
VSHPVDRVLEGLRVNCGPDAYRCSDRLDVWSARCPLHPDAGFTLHVREYPDGRVVFWCRVGCPVAVIEDLLMPDPRRAERAELYARVLAWARTYNERRAA